MTRRLACPPAPGPLEELVVGFNNLFGTLAQWRGFRGDLPGLLSPRERNEALTALGGAEPVFGAQHPGVQRLRFFLSEAPWDAALEPCDRRRASAPSRPVTQPLGSEVKNPRP